uniref:mRNA decay activator protein ZFP36 n=1 Tax=Monopterus albus TaxID=43700 RepID=A0A3Q3QAW5_MONAL
RTITFLNLEEYKCMNMNAIHINSMLDKKAVGAPATTPCSGGSFTPGFFRRNSANNVEAMNNGNKYSMSSYSSVKENTPSSATALMNKENKFRERAYSENADRGAVQQKPGSQINSTRYKTELCRPFEENGSCKYGEKCQFAHGYHELRSLSRHPKYKTEPCRTFHRSARELCGYGQREVLQQQQLSYAQRDRPKLHHSLSFSGFSTHHGLESPLLDSPTSRTPPPPTTASSYSTTSSFYEEVLSPNSVSCMNSAFSFPGQDLKALLAPLAVHTPNSLSDRDSYASGSLSSSGSLSGSESPSLEAGRRLPIFSRLSISDD